MKGHSLLRWNFVITGSSSKKENSSTFSFDGFIHFFAGWLFVFHFFDCEKIDSVHILEGEGVMLERSFFRGIFTTVASP